MKASELAESNFQQHLHHNPYPGRGLVIGRSSEDDSWMIVYWIMGRSANSRNRRLAAENGTVRTVPVDVSQLKDPSLIIYEAMLDFPGVYLVSNGDQTRTMYEAVQKGSSIEEALATREREPDAPNYTPRISGMLDMRKSPSMTLSILKANLIDPTQTDRFYYRPVLPQGGYGYGLTTYSGDGDPLPSFTGDPLLLPCRGSAEDVLKSYWEALDAANRVSLAVKYIAEKGQRSEVLIKNQYEGQPCT